MTVCVIVVTVKLSMETKCEPLVLSPASVLLVFCPFSFWTWMQFVANIGSVFIYFVFLLVYGFMYTIEPGDMVYVIPSSLSFSILIHFPLSYVFLNLSQHAQFWLMVMLVVGISILPDIAIKWFRQSLDPADWQILRVRLSFPWTELFKMLIISFSIGALPPR